MDSHLSVGARDPFNSKCKPIQTSSNHPTCGFLYSGIPKSFIPCLVPFLSHQHVGGSQFPVARSNQKPLQIPRSKPDEGRPERDHTWVKIPIPTKTGSKMVHLPQNGTIGFDPQPHGPHKFLPSLGLASRRLGFRFSHPLVRASRFGLGFRCRSRGGGPPSNPTTPPPTPAPPPPQAFELQTRPFAKI